MLPCVTVYTFRFIGTPLDLMVTVNMEGKVQVAPSWSAGELTDRGIRFGSFPGKLFEFLCTAVREASA